MWYFPILSPPVQFPPLSAPIFPLFELGNPTPFYFTTFLTLCYIFLFLQISKNIFTLVTELIDDPKYKKTTSKSHNDDTSMMIITHHKPFSHYFCFWSSLIASPPLLSPFPPKAPQTPTIHLHDQIYKQVPVVATWLLPFPTAQSTLLKKQSLSWMRKKTNPSLFSCFDTRLNHR